MSVHEEHDIFRHTPLRYLGYTNEIGEAFRYQLSFRALACTYIISTGYVIGDALDKGYKAYNKYHFEEMKTHEKNLARNYVIKTTGLVLLWQIVATEIVPAFIIYQAVKLLKKLPMNMIKNQSIKKWFPTVIGLCIIPTFPYTVDPIIDKLFDKLNLDIDKNLH